MIKLAFLLGVIVLIFAEPWILLIPLSMGLVCFLVQILYGLMDR